MTWRRHFFYRKESLRTTWKVRVALLAVLVVVVLLTRDLWVGAIGRSLMCARDLAPSDVILVENFDPNYLLFERAAELEKTRLAARILVPVQALKPGTPNLVFKGFAEVMAMHAHVGAWDTVLINEIEPISLNAAVEIRQRLLKDAVKSVIVVTPAFRSRRSALVYRTVLGENGIQVHCEPVVGRTTPENWLDTWHGVQGVVEELLKLEYYRFYVIPFRRHYE